MKNFIFALLFSFVTFSVSADEIEFDGAYVKKKNGDHVELVEQVAYSAMFWPNAPKKFSRTAVLNRDRGYYVTDNKAKTIPIEDFKGITFQGSYDDIEFLTIHRVISIVPKDGRDVFLPYENEGRINEGDRVYVAGEKLEIRTKTDSSKSVYIQPREPLKKEMYVAWSGDKFWLFELK